MREPFSWTASLGRWLGVPVRVHLWMFIAAALIFFVEWNYFRHVAAGGQAAALVAGTGLATVLILLVSVLAHELAHVFAATSLGGQVEDITLAPWGGESKLFLPPQHRCQLLIFSAGPFANGVIFVAGSLLVLQTGGELGELVYPLAPIGLEFNKIELSLLKIATWINFQLMWINLLPVYPLDGNKILRAVACSYWPKLSRIKLEAVLMAAGIAIGLGLMVLAWAVRDSHNWQIGPPWLVLVCLGICAVFCARYGFHVNTASGQDWDDVDELTEYDSLYDEEELFDFESEDEAASISQWLQEKQESREHMQAAIEREEERRVDRILEKLHRTGIDSLSDDERSFLNRVSARYRRRRQQPS